MRVTAQFLGLLFVIASAVFAAPTSMPSGAIGPEELLNEVPKPFRTSYKKDAPPDAFRKMEEWINNQRAKVRIALIGKITNVEVSPSTTKGEATLSVSVASTKPITLDGWQWIVNSGVTIYFPIADLDAMSEKYKVGDVVRIQLDLGHFAVSRDTAAKDKKVVASISPENGVTNVVEKFDEPKPKRRN